MLVLLLMLLWLLLSLALLLVCFLFEVRVVSVQRVNAVDDDDDDDASERVRACTLLKAAAQMLREGCSRSTQIGLHQLAQSSPYIGLDQLRSVYMCSDHNNTSTIRGLWPERCSSFFCFKPCGAIHRRGDLRHPTSPRPRRHDNYADYSEGKACSLLKG